MTDFDLQYIIGRLTERGFQRGKDDFENGWARNTAPLSGEWAGESIPELIGDLLRFVEGEDDTELLQAYEDGYNAGFGSLDQCSDCLEWVDEVAETAPDFALCWPCAEARIAKDRQEGQ